jgi:hypothetical protein
MLKVFNRPAGGGVSIIINTWTQCRRRGSHVTSFLIRRYGET